MSTPDTGAAAAAAAGFAHRLSGRPSVTAEAVCMARAVERLLPEGERIVDDPHAQLFLGRGARTALATWSFNGPTARLLRRLDLGGVTYIACRHRYIDDQLAASLDPHGVPSLREPRAGSSREAGAEQVVLLGAGYDSRAYRFADRLAGRPVFEVDLAPISRRKAKVIAANAKALPSPALHRVEIDFETQTLAGTLVPAGFRAGARTFVVWEGVSMYLTRAAVKATLGALRDLCGPGSALAMDGWYLTDDPSPLGTMRRVAPGALSLIGEAITFGVHPEEMPDFLRRLGWEVADVATAVDLAQRYSAGARPVEDSVYLLTATRP